jgi:hypothetical protein
MRQLAVEMSWIADSAWAATCGVAQRRSTVVDHFANPLMAANTRSMASCGMARTMKTMRDRRSASFQCDNRSGG